MTVPPPPPDWAIDAGRNILVVLLCVIVWLLKRRDNRQRATIRQLSKPPMMIGGWTQHYTSTACYHAKHDDCRLDCKHGKETCRCHCHNG